MLSNHIIWKRRLARVLGGRPPSDRCVIVTYHAVGGGPLSMSAESFREQMTWLAHNAKPAHLDEVLAAGGASHGLRVAVTFDDGYENLLSVAAPILHDLGFAATAYLSTASIGDGDHIPSRDADGHYPGESFLIWKEVLALRAMGWTIGSHAHDHVDLSRQSTAELANQLKRSKATIEDHLGSECWHLAYPWGRHNHVVRAAAAAAGYRWAVATRHGPLHAAMDPMAVPRIDVRRDYSLEDFAAAVRGDWDYLGLVQSVRSLFA